MRLIAAAAALLSVSGARAAVKPFCFAQISDTHMSADHPERDDVLKTALGLIARESPRPDFILHTGDITDMGRAADFARYKRNIADAALPIHHTPGNHETRWADQSINRFRAEFGSPNVSFLHNGVRFIGFSAAIWLAHHGAVSGDTRRWIVSELAKDPKGTPAVLFCHQPPHYPSSVQMAGDDELWEAIKPYNVRLFAAGHVHAMRTWWRNGVLCHTTKAMMNDDGYYSLYEVGPDSITVHEVAMGPDGWRKKVAEVPLHETPLTVNVRDLGADRNDPHRRYFAATLDGPREPARGVTSVKWLADPHGRPASPDWVKLDATGPGRYAFTVATDGLIPGRHRLGVRAMDAEGRPWFGATPLVIPGEAVTARVFNAGTVLQAPAAVDDRSVYAGGWDGVFYAVDRRTMRPRWTFQTGGPVIGLADTDARAVFFGSTDGTIHALDRNTGHTLWKVKTGGPIQAHTRVADGTVFVASGDHNFYALDAETGAVRWKRAFGMHAQARPAVANGMVYIGAWDNTFYALDEKTGAVKWTRKTTGPNLMYSPAISSPCAVDGKVILTYPVPRDEPDAPQVVCVDGKTGETLWGARAADSTFSDSSPVSDGKNVYLCSIKGELHALDLKTGKPVWTAPMLGIVNDGGPALMDGAVVCNTLLGDVEAHDAGTGKRLWAWKTGEGFQFARPAVADGVVYQTSFDGTLTALAAK